MSEDKSKVRRADRFGMREVLWSISKGRPGKCGRVRIGANVAVRVREGRAHYSGVASCGSVWACPVCAAKIRQERAEEIGEVLTEHLASGGRAWLVTLTVPHRRSLPLSESLGAAMGSWTAIMRDRGWRAASRSAGLVGWVRAVEVTYGANGWHPHLHAVVLSRGDMGGALLEARRAWSDATVRQGLARPSRAHGVQWEEISAGGDGVARYIAKVQDPIKAGQELTRGDLKAGRASSCTPYDLLRAVRDLGDAQGAHLWREYERATKGRRCVTWSKGLRSKIGLRSDEAIAEAEVGGEVVGLLDAEAWGELCRTRGGVLRFLVGVETFGWRVAWSSRWDRPPPPLYDD